MESAPIADTAETATAASGESAETAAGAETGAAAGTAEAARDPFAGLGPAVAALLEDKGLAGARLGIAIVDVESGRWLYAHNATTPITPASNMKLATTAAALETLGTEWRFRTIVGTLGGDLVVVGSGDPNLSGRFYGGDPVGAVRRWAARLRARGITSVKGSLVVDDSAFDTEFVHPAWPTDQYLEWYEAPVGALVLNDSCIDVQVRGAASAGTPAEVTISPATSYVTVSGQIMTRQGSKSVFSINRPRGSTDVVLRGDVPPKVVSEVYNRTVADPGLFTGTVIRETLIAEGVAIAGPVVRRRVWTADWRLPEGFAPQVYHYSTLAQSVHVANTRSQNLYAECIAKALAAFGESREADRATPTAQGSWARSAAMVRAALGRAGVETEGCVFDDGSGMSARNRLTPAAVAAILVAMARSPQRAMWMDSLAVAGDEVGTLRKRLRGSDAEGRVFGKTGFLNGARSLSGYVRTDSGRLVAFSVLSDGLTSQHGAVKRLQDNVCLELVGR